MKQKKTSPFKRLMTYAGNYKYLTYASIILAAVSAVIALIPFYEVWRIIKEILEVRPDFSQAVHIKTYGWYAVGSALVSMLFYIAALMCSGGISCAGEYENGNDESYHETASWIY